MFTNFERIHEILVDGKSRQIAVVLALKVLF